MYQKAIDDWPRVYDELVTLVKEMPKGETRTLIGCICHDGNGKHSLAQLTVGPPYHSHHALYIMWLTGKYILQHE